MNASSGRMSIASRASGSLLRSAPRSPRPGGLPPSSRMRASMASGVGAEGRRQGREAVGGPGGHEGHCSGQDRGVDSGVGGAADADEGLADDVVEGEGAGVDCVAAEDRALGQGGAVALGGVFVEGGGDQFGAAQGGHPGDRVGEGGVEGVGAVGEGVHRAGAQLGLGGAGHRRRGRRSPARAGPCASTRSSAPAGRRWMPVISAPDIVVGIAATRAPRHRGDRLRGVDRAAAAEGDEVRRSEPSRAAPPLPPAPRSPDPPAAARARRPRRSRAPRAPPGARAVESSSKRSMPCSARSCGAPVDAAGAEDDRAAGVAPDEVAVHPCRGGARVDDRAQVRFDLGPQVLVVGRQRELLAEVLERLVDGEARAERGDLEEDAARLAEVDRAEVEAVDHRGRLRAGRDRPLAPLLVLVHGRGPGDVVDAAGALQRALLAAALRRRRGRRGSSRAPPSCPRRPARTRAPRAGSRLASGAAL